MLDGTVTLLDLFYIEQKMYFIFPIFMLLSVLKTQHKYVPLI